MRSRGVWVLMALLFAAVVQAQSVRVKGGFMADSLKIGVPTSFVLTARHSPEATVLFPDTTFAFTPFEFSKRTYFPTRTQAGESLDSVVYELTSFEIDSIQFLLLPVYLVVDQDCTVWMSPRDSIFLKELVADVPDSVQTAELPMKINTSYQFVNKLLNYPLALLIAGLLVVVAGIVALVFGKRIRQYFLQRRLRKQHAQFLTQFQRQMEKLEANFSASQAESCLVIWKTYMEQLLAFPITKLTSREIIQQLSDIQLKPVLSEIDRMIYADIRQGLRSPFETLQEKSQKAFEQKLAETKHG